MQRGECGDPAISLKNRKRTDVGTSGPSVSTAIQKPDFKERGWLGSDLFSGLSSSRSWAIAREGVNGEDTCQAVVTVGGVDEDG